MKNQLINRYKDIVQCCYIKRDELKKLENIIE